MEQQEQHKPTPDQQVEKPQEQKVEQPQVTPEKFSELVQQNIEQAKTKADVAIKEGQQQVEAAKNIGLTSEKIVAIEEATNINPKLREIEDRIIELTGKITAEMEALPSSSSPSQEQPASTENRKVSDDFFEGKDMREILDGLQYMAEREQVLQGSLGEYSPAEIKRLIGEAYTKAYTNLENGSLEQSEEDLNDFLASNDITSSGGLRESLAHIVLTSFQRDQEAMHRATREIPSELARSEESQEITQADNPIGEQHPQQEILQTSASFEDFLRSRDESLPLDRLEEVKQYFEQYGLGDAFDPQVLPPDAARLIRNFAEEDWRFITQSSEKILSLTTIFNHHRNSETLRRQRQVEGEGPRLRRTVDVNEPSPREVAELGTLPLIYGTKLETLNSLLEQGRLWSDRENVQQTIPELDADVDYQTNTTLADRRVGLDQYAFCSFGKPGSRSYGSVEILFKPDTLLSNPKSFATENDYLDYQIATDPKGEDRYRDQILQGRYFYEDAARRLKDRLNSRSRDYAPSLTADEFLRGSTDIRDQFGNTTFSTWEVKVPELSKDAIDSVVFSSADELIAFRQQNPETDFSVKFKPNGSELYKVASEHFGVSVEGISSYIDSLPVEQVFHHLEQARPGIGQELANYLNAEITFSPTHTYKLNSNEVSEKLYQDEINEGGEARLARLEASTEEKSTCYIEVAENDEVLISPSLNIYKIATGRILTSEPPKLSEQEIATQERRVRQNFAREVQLGLRDPNELPPERKKQKYLKIEVLKTELEAALSNRTQSTERHIQTYRVDELLEY